MEGTAAREELPPTRSAIGAEAPRDPATLRDVPAPSWTDSELLRALDAPASSLPGKLVAAFAEARRRGLEPRAAAILLAVGHAILDRPGSALLLGLASTAILGGWPLLAAALDHAVARWVIAGWGTAALFALALPALMAVALQLVRRRPPDPAALRRALAHAPTAVAGLAVAFTWAVPAVLLGLVPCLGGLLVFTAWLALLIRAGAATCLALEHGLDPLSALAAHAHAERRWGRSTRYGLAGSLTILVVLGFIALLLGAFALEGGHEGWIAGALLGGAGAVLGLLLVSAAFLLCAAAHAAALSIEGSRCAAPAEARYGPLDPRPGPLPWLATAALLIPLGTPFWGAALHPLIHSSTLPMATWAAIPTAHLVALGGGLLLLHLHRARVRVVAVDRTGVTLDARGGWAGRYVAWSRVRGFALEEDGVRLVIEGERLSRWLGPIVPAREREVHDLVQLLEQLGLPRL